MVYPITAFTQDSTAIHQIEDARTLYKAKDYEASLRLYKDLIAEFVASKNWEQWDKCYAGIWLCYYRMDNEKATLDTLPLHISTLPKDQYFYRAKSMYRRGWTLNLFGHIYTSNQVFEKALQVVNKVPAEQDSLARTIKLAIYRYLGNTNSQLGDNNTAKKYGKEGFRYAESIQDSVKMKEFLSLYGKYCFHNDETLEAIKTYKNVLANYPPEAYVRRYLAEAYIYADSLDEAKFQLDLTKQMLEPDEIDVHILALESLYYLKTGQVDRAITLKEKQIKEARNSFRSRYLARELVRYAQYLFDDGQYEKSVQLAHEAIRTFDTSLDSLNLMDRILIDAELLPDIHIIEAIYIKAKYFNNQYLNTKDDSFLVEATFYYETLTDLFNELKLTYKSKNSQYRLGSYTQKIYANAIQFYSSLFLKTGEVDHYNKALHLAQSANAFVLKNSVGERKRFELAGVPSDSINLFYHLKSKVNEADSTSDISTQVDQLNSYILSLRNSYPAIDKYDNDQVVDLNSIQESLKPDQLLVKYFYSDSLMVRFTVSDANFDLKIIELPSNFQSLVKEVQQLSSNPNIWQPDEYARKSKQVYDLVLADAIQKYKTQRINHIIIVPDGPLKGISFNALITNEIQETIKPTDYLIHDYELSYLYYCAQISSSKKSQSKKRFIGFGLTYDDPFLQQTITEYINDQRSMDTDRTFYIVPLHYAVEETRQIASIIGGDYLTDNEVTLDQVLKNIDNYNIAHFSTHAFVNNDDYLNSFIALSSDESGNFKLRYSDIVNLDLDAEMVVLSACHTVSGTNIIGEGLMSLSRAFTQSGCQSTVGSYWNVPDKATSELMQQFYSNLKSDMTKSAAMRNAQLEYLNADSKKSKLETIPFYWSSWAIYGNIEPISTPSFFSNTHPLFLILGGLLIIGIPILYYINKK